MRALLLTCLALALASSCLAGPATAAPAAPPPLVGSCNAVTKPCWDGSLACVWISLQVPVCVGNPTG
ncbi:MAG: hypothetical protein LC623_05555 [Halobacteriales archaeon]|nr:hypothetical protein [Halobacteriales archaeon]